MECEQKSEEMECRNWVETPFQLILWSFLVYDFWCFSSFSIFSVNLPPLPFSVFFVSWETSVWRVTFVDGWGRWSDEELEKLSRAMEELAAEPWRIIPSSLVSRLVSSLLVMMILLSKKRWGPSGYAFWTGFVCDVGDRPLLGLKCWEDGWKWWFPTWVIGYNQPGGSGTL